MKKILNLIFGIILSLYIFSVPVFAQSDNELTELCKKYFEDESIIDVEYTDNEYGVSYKFTKKPLDYSNISFSIDSEIKFDAKELADIINCNSNLFTLSSYFNNDYKKQTLTITFSTQEHELNKSISLKLYEVLKEKYNIISAFTCLDAQNTSEDERIMWNLFYGKDEFGYKVSTEEQFSKKQINNIRNEISLNNFAVTVDDNGKIVFDESASEIEKFQFALWFKNEYGYSVQVINNGLSYASQYDTTIVMHYTELYGDVNNDNKVSISDAVMMQRYLLSETDDEYNEIPYICFNVKNADLNSDGVIDIFDLVSLRKQIIYSDE